MATKTDLAYAKGFVSGLKAGQRELGKAARAAAKRTAKPTTLRRMFISHDEHVEVTVDGPSAVTAFVLNGKLHVMVWKGARRPSEQQDSVLAFDGERETVATGGEYKEDES